MMANVQTFSSTQLLVQIIIFNDMQFFGQFETEITSIEEQSYHTFSVSIDSALGKNKEKAMK